MSDTNNNEPDLSMVATDDLFAELASRFDASAFTGLKNTSRAEDEYTYIFHGSACTTLGLLSLAMRSLRRTITSRRGR